MYRVPLLRWLGMIALAVGLAAPLAQAQDTVRVRGTIDRVEGDVYLVKARDGSELKLKLAANAVVVSLVAAALADIKQGDYVGVAGMPCPTAARKPWRCTSSPRPCAARAMATAAGTCNPRAP